jgi:hypothetical protein
MANCNGLSAPQQAGSVSAWGCSLSRRGRDADVADGAASCRAFCRCAVSNDERHRSLHEFGARAVPGYCSAWHGAAHSCSVHHQVTRLSRPLTRGMAASNPISSRA